MHQTPDFQLFPFLQVKKQWDRHKFVNLTVLQRLINNLEYTVYRAEESPTDCGVYNVLNIFPFNFEILDTVILPRFWIPFIRRPEQSVYIKEDCIGLFHKPYFMRLWLEPEMHYELEYLADREGRSPEEEE